MLILSNMKMIIRNLFFSVIFLTTIYSFKITNSCTCGPYNHIFCEVVRSYHHVAVVEITEEISYSTKRANVISNLNLEIPIEEIIILGQDGVNCGENMELFEIGDTLILGLFLYNDSIYYLDGCGRHYLKLSNNKVTGGIYQGIEEISYENFVDGLNECLVLVDVLETEKLENIEVFPNPTRNKLIIGKTNVGIDAISILNSKGELLLEQSNQLIKERIILDIETLHPGIYFVRILTERGLIVKRFVKI